MKIAGVVSSWNRGRFIGFIFCKVRIEETSCNINNERVTWKVKNKSRNVIHLHVNLPLYIVNNTINICYG